MIQEKRNDIDRMQNYRGKTHQLQQKTSFTKPVFFLIWKITKSKSGRMGSKGREKVTMILVILTLKKKNWPFSV